MACLGGMFGGMFDSMFGWHVLVACLVACLMACLVAYLGGMFLSYEIYSIHTIIFQSCSLIKIDNSKLIFLNVVQTVN